jgi:hypothetical protein
MYSGLFLRQMTAIASQWQRTGCFIAVKKMRGSLMGLASPSQPQEDLVRSDRNNAATRLQPEGSHSQARIMGGGLP